ncbi:hypothetical protein COMA1_10843 [Candidatus Nitrospira nitrosa]|uniref:Uncharacterized protein n=1 Tax=Candidatus Nitrospira nitrosa TaxID=1742972 RepID=A0A0S4LCI1_9BACT|nr:hypothetical protein COMA1_10843 [Candidatus Nitrospira nitrosa]
MRHEVGGTLINADTAPNNDLSASEIPSDGRKSDAEFNGIDRIDAVGHNHCRIQLVFR